MRVLICAAWLAGCASTVTSASTEWSCAWTLAETTPIRGPIIDGVEAKLHTQGLYVTDAHYLVTARLEGPPEARRALLLRYPRDDLAGVESLDITPAKTDKLRDHPGGFDFDGTDFWIPVSASEPFATTSVVRVRHEPTRPLADAEWSAPFEVRDHLGAIAVDQDTGRLYGASWDTIVVYVLTRDGGQLEAPNYQAFLAGGDFEVAVQDWKGIGAGLVLASGKLRGEREETIVALVDVSDRERVGAPCMPGPIDGQFLGREGMHLVGRDLYFLPGDLGAGAKLLRFTLD